MLKKQKLMVGLCVPAAALVAAGGVSAIILSQKNSTSNGDFRLSFSTDENSRFIDDDGVEQNVYSGTTLDRIKQPQVQSYKSGYMFTGWQDQDGHNVPGQYKIVKNDKLHASFADTTTGDYVTVTFKKKSTEPDVRLHGNVSIATKKGYLFLMVNRPSAEWNNNYFENWQRYDSEKKQYVDVTEADTITQDTVLYPKFTQAVTMTWNPGKGGGITRGQTTTTLAAGTAFDKFNQPQLYNSDLNKVFKNWYKDENCTDGNEWKKTDIVTANSVAYAGWGDGKSTDATHHILEFVQNATQKAAGFPEVTFAPSTSTIVAYKEDDQGEPTIPPTWGDAVRPTVSTTSGNYELDKWQYLDDSDPDPEKHTWEELTDAHEFVTTETKKTTQIRPVMKSSVSAVTIVGESTVLPESTNTYYAVVAGSDNNPMVSQVVEWDLFEDKECKKPLISGAKIDKSSGVLTVDSLTKAKTIYVQATSKTTVTPISKVMEVNIEMPYVNSQSFWFHDGTQWWSISQKDGLCVETDMTAYALNESKTTATKTITRGEDFNYTLYVGRLLTSIYDQFGYKWTGFNGDIDLGESNVTVINGSFLEGCTKFNKSLDLHKITKIGSSFLYNCSTFGTPGIDPETGEAVYTSLLKFTDEDGNSALRTIGDNFLGCCTSYNRVLELPNNEITIGDAFLFKCSDFNQNITIPANVVSVDDFFMMGCDDFMSTITIGSQSTTFVENINSISSTSSGANIYVYGFKVAGDGGSKFAAAFPTHTTNNAWRKIQTGDTTAKIVTEEQYTAAMTSVFSADATLAGMNYTCQMPDEFKSITATVDNGKIFNNLTGTLNVKNGTDLNGTWGRYNQFGSSEDYRLTDIEAGNYIPDPYNFYGEKFVTLLGGEGEASFSDFEFDATTGKYKLAKGKTFHIYEGGKPIECQSVELEFYPASTPAAASDHKLYQITIKCNEFGPNLMTWTFNNYGSTVTPTPVQGPRPVSINTRETGSTTTAYAGTAFTITDTDDNRDKLLTFKSSAVATELVPTKTLEIKLADSATRTTKHNMNPYGIFAYDATTGEEVEIASTETFNGVLYVYFDEAPSNDLLIDVRCTVADSTSYGTSLTAIAKWVNMTGTADFTTCEWSTIATNCAALEAGTMTEAEFCAAFNNGHAPCSSMSDFIGLQRTITLNGIKHTLDVVATQHDNLATGTGKAALTFQSTHLFSGENGEGYMQVYGDNNISFSTSTLYNSLNDASADISWYKRTDTKTPITGKSIYYYLNEALGTGVVKQVTKSVATASTTETPTFAVSTYSAYCFIPTLKEMNQTPTGSLAEGTVYPFWKLDSSTKFKSETWGNGMDYWLASPVTTGSTYAWAFNYNSGAFIEAAVDSFKGITFAFCI